MNNTYLLEMQTSQLCSVPFIQDRLMSKRMEKTKLQKDLKQLQSYRSSLDSFKSNLESKASEMESDLQNTGKDGNQF